MLSVMIYRKQRVSQVAPSFLGMFTKSQKQLLALSCLSVHLPAWNNLATTGQIFMKFDMSMFKKSAAKIQV